jgi:transcriptional regulator with XRE-family HTH domain
MRALGAELIALRKAANLNTIKAAKKVGMSPASFNRTENGIRLARVPEVSAMLAVYEASIAVRNRLMDMARDLNTPAWLETGAKLPRLLPALAQFESEAVSITEFSPTMVHGLLQTPAYARAVIGTTKCSSAEAELRLRARMNRQKILNKLVSPLYVAVLDEAALRRPCGGSAAMAQQIHWLIDRAKLPNISIHVIPYRIGEYHNPGHFSALDCRNEPTAIYFEHDAAAGFLEEPDEIQTFCDHAATLVRTALSSADSVNFLVRMVADYERS